MAEGVEGVGNIAVSVGIETRCSFEEYILQLTTTKYTNSKPSLYKDTTIYMQYFITRSKREACWYKLNFKVQGESRGCEKVWGSVEHSWAEYWTQYRNILSNWFRIMQIVLRNQLFILLKKVNVNRLKVKDCCKHKSLNLYIFLRNCCFTGIEFVCIKIWYYRLTTWN